MYNNSWANTVWGICVRGKLKTIRMTLYSNSCDRSSGTALTNSNSLLIYGVTRSALLPLHFWPNSVDGCESAICRGSHSHDVNLHWQCFWHYEGFCMLHGWMFSELSNSMKNLWWWFLLLKYYLLFRRHACFFWGRLQVFPIPSSF